MAEQLTPKEINNLIVAVDVWVNAGEGGEQMIGFMASLGGDAEKVEEIKAEMRRKRIKRREHGILLQAKLIKIRCEIEDEEKQAIISDITKSLNGEKGDQ